jgi:hypothetical protein
MFGTSAFAQTPFASLPSTVTNPGTWVLIDNIQASAWDSVDNIQTATWAPIDNIQSPDWVDIDNEQI